MDNCGGAPLRLKETFDFRPGAARVGGEIVLCSGRPVQYPGVWELLEDGSAGEDLGLGVGCLDGVYDSVGFRTGLWAHGFVYRDSALTQYQPDGTVRSLPPSRWLSRVNDTWVAQGSEGEVVLWSPEGPDPLVLELPEPITELYPPQDSSPWVLLSPEPDREDPIRLDALDTTDGSWFTLPWMSENDFRNNDPNRIAARDGLAVTAFSSGWNLVEFMRADWDAPVQTDLPLAAGFTVIDQEHVMVAGEQGVRLLRIPLQRPGDDEPRYELVWERSLPSEEGPGYGYPGMLWKDVVLLPFLSETWAFPVDGSEPYPFLPAGLDLIHFGDEFVTVMEHMGLSGEENRLLRRALGGELEVIAEGVLGFRDRPNTPELGRILYAVRDGDKVSIRQHRLSE